MSRHDRETANISDETVLALAYWSGQERARWDGGRQKAVPSRDDARGDAIECWFTVTRTGWCDSQTEDYLEDLYVKEWLIEYYRTRLELAYTSAMETQTLDLTGASVVQNGVQEGEAVETRMTLEQGSSVEVDVT